jgi:pilus assembly protein CpaE
MQKLDFENYDIACFSQNEETSHVLNEALQRLNEVSSKIYPGNIRQAVEYLKSPSRAKVVCVDCPKRDLLITDAEEIMEFCPPDTNIVILGDENDVGIYRDLVKLNIADYLVKPISAEILLRSFETALNTEKKITEPQRKRSGKVILFMGTVGGVGTTTLATNTATILANEMGKKVTLIDGDFQFGNVCTMLNLKPSHVLHDALESPERIDDVFLDQSMGTYGERLRVISADEPLHETIDLSTDHLANLDQLMGIITAKYHYVVIDLCRHHPTLWRYFNHHAHSIFLVSNLSIPSLRDTMRILAPLTEEKGTKTHAIVINHISAKPTIHFSRFEENLGRKIDVEIAHNTLACEAIDNGIPLVQKSPAFRSDIDRIIEIITGVQNKRSSAPFLTKIAKRISGK